MSLSIYNGGIFGGILRIVKDSGGELSEKDNQRLEYLESLPKNTWVQLDENGMALTNEQAENKFKQKMGRFSVNAIKPEQPENPLLTPSNQFWLEEANS